MLKNLSTETIRGALMGAALGDALGFPYDGYSSVYTGTLTDDLFGQFKAHRSGRYAAGQVTAFTQLTLALLPAMPGKSSMDVSSRAVGGVLFPLAREGRLVKPSLHLLAAMEAWARMRNAPRADSVSAPVHLLPLAFLSFSDEAELLRAIREAALPTGHDFPESLAVAAVFLFTLRYILSVEDIVLGDLIDEARAAAGHFSDTVSMAVDAIPELLYQCRRKSITPALSDTADQMIDAVLSGLMGFLMSPYDYRHSLLMTLKSGGGCAPAFVCGAFSGALNGESRLPEGLIAALPNFQEADHDMNLFVAQRDGASCQERVE